MADEAIKKEIAKLLENDSSFSFEMQVLQELTNKKFKCEHSGLYTDPYTKKNREFDIRAMLDVQDNWHINLAVECKKIDVESPLIIHSTVIPRSERVHSLIINYSNYKKREVDSQAKKTFKDLASFSRPSLIVESSQAKGFDYLVNYRETTGGSFPSLTSDFEYVGRSMDQLKTKMMNGTKTYYLNDSEVYEKFSQAQNSLVDLIENSYDFSYEEGEVIHQFFNLPILVVPNDTIWEQRYNSNGKKHELYSVKRVPFYINKNYNSELHQFTPSFFLRFMDIVTLDGLRELLDAMLKNSDGFNYRVFLPTDEVERAYCNHIVPEVH